MVRVEALDGAPVDSRFTTSGSPNSLVAGTTSLTPVTNETPNSSLRLRYLPRSPASARSSGIVPKVLVVDFDNRISLARHMTCQYDFKKSPVLLPNNSHNKTEPIKA